MLAAPENAYRGDQLHEDALKKALQRLDPDISFDMGSSLEIWHPKINRWQGVHRLGRHIAGMGRGMLPEFNLYREEEDALGVKIRGELLEVGWRTTVELIGKKRIPGLSPQAICLALGRDYKKFVGDPSELHIPEHKVDLIHSTLG